MKPTFETLNDLSTTEIAKLLNRAFEGYIVPIRFDAGFLAEMVRTEGIDLAAGLRTASNGQDTGIALIARRGWTSRVAAMAICPEHRGCGVGSALMKQVITAARSRGERSVKLEVIEQNEAALHLYESIGLLRTRRLVGFVCEEPKMAAPAGQLLEETDVPTVARLIEAESPDLPWQISGATLAQLGTPNRAYRLGRAHAIVSDPERSTIVLRAMVVPDGHRRLGWGSNLIAALKALYHGRIWRVPPVVPDHLADEFFQSCGFERTELSQWEMAIDL